MYLSQKTASRINTVAKSKKIAVKDVLSECGLNKNTISTMLSRKSWIKADSLAIIADYLNCSVDYLLGRTDYTEEENQLICQNLKKYLPLFHGNFKTINGVEYEIPYKIFSDIEKNIYKFTEETLSYIANLCEISPEELLKIETSSNHTLSHNTINGNFNVVGNNSQISVKEELTKQEQELIGIFRNLSETNKAKVLIYTAELNPAKKD